MKDLMIDIETLGTSNNAVITQIGAVYFDRNTGDYGSQFLENIRIQDSLNKGFQIDQGSLEFWLKQGAERQTFLKNPEDVLIVLGNLGDFIDYSESIIWSHATFDIPILSNYYVRTGLTVPYSYRNCRDIRTLVDITKLLFDRKQHKERKTHNALEDCIYQVEYITKCFKVLKEYSESPNKLG